MPEAPVSVTERGKVLFGLAGPDLYERNAFRVLGLPISASNREVSRRERQITLSEKAGVECAIDCLVAPDSPPDSGVRRAAMQSIYNPNSRLVEEIFWFWPCGADGSSDDGLCALREGRYRDAVRLWESLAQDRADGAAGRHNLAVMAHLMALNLERRVLSHTDTAEEEGRRHTYWTKAFDHWAACLSTPSYWDHLSDRVRELADPRLTRSTVEAYRSLLPTMLLSINAKLAITYAEQGSKEAAWHVELLRRSGLGDSHLETALTQALDPMRTRTNALATSATEEATESPAEGHVIARRLMDEAARPLQVFDMLLGEQHLVTVATHDEVALAVLAVQIKYGAKTQDWKTSVELLQRALKIASSTTAKQRIQKNLSICQGNWEFDSQYGTCWFCRRRPAVEPAALKLKMYGNVTRTNLGLQIRVNWEHGEYPVPRCKVCKTLHNLTVPSILVGFFVGGILCAALPSNNVAVCLGLGPLLVYGLPRWVYGRTRWAQSKTKFPPIATKLKAGWGYGSKPPGVQ